MVKHRKRAEPGDPFPVPKAAEADLDRRRLLLAAACALPAVLAGDWLGRAMEGATPPPPGVNPLETVGLERGQGRAVVIADGREALVARLAGGEIVAFDRRCPHLGCPVVWAASRGRFECPCHRAAFDARTGRVLTGPPRRGLTPVEVA